VLGRDCANFDWHVRGQDLVVSYGDDASRPLWVDLLWRATPGDGRQAIVAALDLIVSVRTPLLDSRPRMSVVSELLGDNVRRLIGATSRAFTPISLVDSMRMSPAEGPSCVLFQLPDTPLSYVEMIHPSDFVEDELLRLPAPRALALRHGLFVGNLEKGVVLRCRLRGAFVPRENDEPIAAACYGQFVAEEPFLGT
jgi:hypothetical protein